MDVGPPRKCKGGRRGGGGGCGKRPSFGDPRDRVRLYCAQHKRRADVNLVRGRADRSSSAESRGENVQTAERQQRQKIVGNDAVIWVKYDEYPWWPARYLLENESAAEDPPPGLDLVVVRFLGSDEVAWLSPNNVSSALY